jgi:hypothetical protein
MSGRYYFVAAVSHFLAEEEVDFREQEKEVFGGSGSVLQPQRERLLEQGMSTMILPDGKT